MKEGTKQNPEDLPQVNPPEAKAGAKKSRPPIPALRGRRGQTKATAHTQNGTVKPSQNGVSSSRSVAPQPPIALTDFKAGRADRKEQEPSAEQQPLLAAAAGAGTDSKQMAHFQEIAQDYVNYLRRKPSNLSGWRHWFTDNFYGGPHSRNVLIDMFAGSIKGSFAFGRWKKNDYSNYIAVIERICKIDPNAEDFLEPFLIPMLSSADINPQKIYKLFTAYFIYWQLQTKEVLNEFDQRKIAELVNEFGEVNQPPPAPPLITDSKETALSDSKSTSNDDDEEVPLLLQPQISGMSVNALIADYYTKVIADFAQSQLDPFEKELMKRGVDIYSLQQHIYQNKKDRNQIKSLYEKELRGLKKEINNFGEQFGVAERLVKRKSHRYTQVSIVNNLPAELVPNTLYIQLPNDDNMTIISASDSEVKLSETEFKKLTEVFTAAEFDIRTIQQIAINNYQTAKLIHKIASICGLGQAELPQYTYDIADPNQYYGEENYEQNKVEKRKIKTESRRRAKIIAALVGFGEGLVAMFGFMSLSLLAGSPLGLVYALGGLVFLGGAFVNYYLIKEDAYVIWRDWRLGKLFTKDDGTPVSRGKWWAMCIFGALSITAGFSYGVLSFLSVSATLTPLLGGSIVAAGFIAAFPATATFFGLTCIFFFVIADFVKRERWTEINSYLKENWGIYFQGWRLTLSIKPSQMSYLQIFTHVMRVIFWELPKATFAIAVMGVITFISLGLFHTAAVDVLKKICSLKIADGVGQVFSAINGLIGLIFGVEKINSFVNIFGNWVAEKIFNVSKKPMPIPVEPKQILRNRIQQVSRWSRISHYVKGFLGLAANTFGQAALYAKSATDTYNNFILTALAYPTETLYSACPNAKAWLEAEYNKSIYPLDKQDQFELQEEKAKPKTTDQYGIRGHMGFSLARGDSKLVGSPEKKQTSEDQPSTRTNNRSKIPVLPAGGVQNTLRHRVTTSASAAAQRTDQSADDAASRMSASDIGKILTASL